MDPFQVLLVEDNAGDALLISQILAEAAMPVKLRIARDGAQAFQMLAEGFKPHIVILDLTLPQVGGLEIMEQYHPADVPIVIFSASKRESDKLLSKTLGASEYIVKPSDLDVFRAAVLGIVDRWRPHSHGTATA
jgi:DNA-binding response OmpR family regulator